MKETSFFPALRRGAAYVLVGFLAASLGCGASMARPKGAMLTAASATTPAMAPGSRVGGGANGETTPTLKEQLLIEGTVEVAVNDVPTVADAIRVQVQSMGGRIMREDLGGGAKAWSASMKLRIPPEKVTPFLEWLARQGSIERKAIQATDVSRTLFDQQIALENLEHTLARLRKLLDHQQLTMKEVLEIEKEMTRLRGEIERIKGEQRFLRDRVAFATLDIAISRREGAILKETAKFYPGVRGSSLILLDPDGRKRTRLGGGAVIQFTQEGRSSLEVDVFPETGDEGRAVIATMGGATYSDFLGGGRRCYLNPYLGLRLGYGYVDAHSFVAAGDAGVELYKHKYLMVDANLRVATLINGDGADVVFMAGGGIVVPF